MRSRRLRKRYFIGLKKARQEAQGLKSAKQRRGAMNRSKERSKKRGVGERRKRHRDQPCKVGRLVHVHNVEDTK
jgi:hypothetical protein